MQLAVRWYDFDAGLDRDGLLLQVGHGRPSSRTGSENTNIAFVLTVAKEIDTWGKVRVGDQIILAVHLNKIVVKGANLPFDMRSAIGA